MAGPGPPFPYRWYSVDPRNSQHCDYDPAVQQRLEAMFQTPQFGTGSVAFVVKGNTFTVEVKAAQMVQANATGGTRTVVRLPQGELPRWQAQGLPLPAAPATPQAAAPAYRWYSVDPRNSQHCDYDPAVQQRLEAMFQTPQFGTRSVAFLVKGNPFMVNVAQMLQENATGGTRTVMREPRGELPRWQGAAASPPSGVKRSAQSVPLPAPTPKRQCGSVSAVVTGHTDSESDSSSDGDSGDGVSTISLGGELKKRVRTHGHGNAKSRKNGFVFARMTMCSGDMTSKDWAVLLGMTRATKDITKPVLISQRSQGKHEGYVRARGCVMEDFGGCNPSASSEYFGKVQATALSFNMALDARRWPYFLKPLLARLLDGMPEKSVKVVPVREGGAWRERVDAPGLVAHPEWHFNRYDVDPNDQPVAPDKLRNMGLPVIHSDVSTLRSVTGDGSIRFEWCLLDPHTAIATMLSACVAHPFVSADWGLRMGSDFLALPKQWTAPEGHKFAIPHNQNDPEAACPAGWTADKDKQLRTEQRRALHWMQSRELAADLFESPVSLRIAPPFELNVKLRYRSRGGVLADRIGYGKTATFLALMAAHAPGSPALSGLAADPFALTADEQAQYFDLSTTTLVIAPSHLLDQWEGEIRKFLGNAPKVLVVKNITPLTTRTVRELRAYDVVLMSYKLLHSPKYWDRLNELTGCDWSTRNLVLRERTRQVLAAGHVDNYPEWHDKSKVINYYARNRKVSAPDDLTFPMPSQCFWRRVVLDEFHEAEAQTGKQGVALAQIRARARWGLTGTPNVHDVDNVQRMARLLHVDLVVDSIRGKGSLQKLRVAYSAADVDKCQRFVTMYVRQNEVSAGVDRIKTEYHTVPVTLSRAEHLLYLQQERAVGTPDAEYARTQLVMLCSHFNTSAKVGASAEDETRDTLLKLRKAFENAAQEAKQKALCAYEVLRRTDRAGSVPAERAFAVPAGRPSGGVVPGAQTPPTWFSKNAQDALRAMRASECKELRSCVNLMTKHQLQRLPKRGRRALAEEWQRHAEAWGVTDYDDGDDLDAEDLWLVQPIPDHLRFAISAAAEKRLVALLDHHRRYFFFQSCLKAFAAADKEEQECSVCLGSQADGVAAWSILPCGHIFCAQCVGTLCQQCAQCRTPFNEKDVFDVAAQTHSLQSMTKSIDFCEEAGKADSGDANEDDSSDGGTLQGRWSKYGSKIQKICETLRQVKFDDPKAKVIVFCQWQSLQNKIARAFKKYKFRFSVIEGSTAKQNRVLTSFQNDAPLDDGGPAPEILLLNLEFAASGANCTAASYVFLVHPFNAADVTKAAAYELQAIGRVRRLGQPREKVHVYRFVTNQTVEEVMTKEREEQMKNAPGQ
eukprot:TRINITY_DN4152_c0_g1_i1.p1 TRINITY_DN4152_c0_g1~~TRINITY_DN4152_c0_g1_i1.p1  ORF type:complete len:1382 (+),score=305.65 TRINITY_DN4152_c0_g1_i1:60-4148(+)